MGVIYQNSPLIELIAELQWTLTPLTVAPGAAVDPFFDVTEADLKRGLATAGFPLVESVVPPEVPREILAWKATTRFSRSSPEWPKFQVGPGVFTANVAGPHYTGWPSFRNQLHRGFSALFNAYPDPTRLLRLKSLQLRYVNAFTRKQGFDSFTTFVSEHLRLSPVLPRQFAASFSVDEASISTSSSSRFPIPDSGGSFASIHVSDGAINNAEPACVVHFAVDCAVIAAPNTDSVLAWLDSAHDFADKMFDKLLSDELKAKMNPREGS